MTITEFLLPRIAEDEAEAERWRQAMDADEEIGRGTPAWIVMAGGIKVPDRVLAECKAKRRIVELHQPFEPYGGLGVKCEVCADNVEADYDGTPMTEWPCPTLRHLASVYADHPDFDPAWRVAD